jgi:DNA-binding transcriptional MerR regulator
MEKSPDAFRTISEVADLLETPAHVLRFWETRFPQVRPVKRAGGRRYYRPGDVSLLAGIRRLLHDEGMTIRGVQKVLREQGIRHVAGLSAIDLSGSEMSETEDSIEAQLLAALGPIPDLNGPAPETAPETAQIIALETVLAQKDAARAAEETLAMRRDLFDFDAIPDPAPALAPTPAPTPIAVVTIVSPAPQPSENAPDSGTALARGLVAARLRQAQRAGGITQGAALSPLAERLRGLRDRLAEGTRKRPH